MIILRGRRSSSVIFRRTLGVGLSLAAATSACSHPSPTPTPATASGQPVPVYQEPRHHLVYRNPLVRVLDVRIPAGDTSAYHIHDAPMVGVVIQDARTWSQVPGAPAGPVRTPPPAPSAFTNWTQELPYTHRVANVDSVPLHYVVAEWLGRKGGEVPALPTDEDRKLVEDGPTVRVYQITLEPNAATWPHTHVGPGLVVQATDGDLIDDGGPRAHGGSGAGSWSWREGPYRHRLRNAGPRKLVVYEIDWR
ncbi:MAG TPA: hypothetical protein VFJ92_05365 [Gemmatimonadales bacterium]|jgi:hypothetical protein|nr:hypothetical protein [Gemmatimonadales bacterium]